MDILVLPVSGGGFVNQLAIMEHLCESGYKPGLIMASSGGNLAAYIALASEWKWQNIRKISTDLNKELFSTQWNSIGMLSTFIGYFKGELYNSGKGVKEFFRKYFNDLDIGSIEIWTGAYNTKRKKFRIFCNKSGENSFLSLIDSKESITQIMEPFYGNCDIDIISSYSTASASIPSIVPPVIIEKETYADGGIAGASPLTPMYIPLINSLPNNNLHIIYVNSFDMLSPNSAIIRNVVDNLKQTTGDLLRSQAIIDRSLAINLISNGTNLIGPVEFVCNSDNLKSFFNIKYRMNSSMLEIYPIVREEVDVTNFTGDQISLCIANIYTMCKCRLWYVSSTNLDDYFHSLSNINK